MCEQCVKESEREGPSEDSSQVVSLEAERSSVRPSGDHPSQLKVNLTPISRLLKILSSE